MTKLKQNRGNVAGILHLREFACVGEYPVRGFSDPIELFAYHG
jgi:hypothetical protein